MKSISFSSHFKSTFLLAYPVVISQVGHMVVNITDTVCGDLALPCDDIFDDVSLDIRQAEISPGVAIRQAGVVEAKQL